NSTPSTAELDHVGSVDNLHASRATVVMHREQPGSPGRLLHRERPFLVLFFIELQDLPEDDRTSVPFGAVLSGPEETTFVLEDRPCRTRPTHVPSDGIQGMRSPRPDERVAHEQVQLVALIAPRTVDHREPPIPTVGSQERGVTRANVAHQDTIELPF